MPKISVTKGFSFEASHYIPNYDGACSNLHGHSYKLQVTVSTDTVNSVTGMVLDFNILKSIVNNRVVDRYDHSHLNDYFNNPTAEYMAQQIFLDLDKEFSEIGVTLDSIKLWETENSFAECRR